MKKARRMNVRTTSMEQLEARALLHGGMHSDFGDHRLGAHVRMREESLIVSSGPRSRESGPGADFHDDRRGAIVSSPHLSLKVPSSTPILLIITPPSLRLPEITPPPYSPPTSPSSQASALGRLPSTSFQSNATTSAQRDPLTRVTSSSHSQPTSTDHSTGNPKAEVSRSATGLSSFVSFLSPTAPSLLAPETPAPEVSGQPVGDLTADSSAEPRPSAASETNSLAEAQPPAATTDDSDELLELSAENNRERERRKLTRSHSSLLADKSDELARRASAYTGLRTTLLNLLAWRLENDEPLTVADHPDLIELLAGDQADAQDCVATGAAPSSWEYESATRLEANIDWNVAFELLDEATLPTDTIAAATSPAPDSLPTAAAR